MTHPPLPNPKLRTSFDFSSTRPSKAQEETIEATTFKMADSLDYIKICESCPAGDGWGPSVTTETTLNGVPYAPFSKGDKLGRMADWTAEGKSGERGGRAQYNRNYRGRSCYDTLLLFPRIPRCLSFGGMNSWLT